jgi:hypothetical protein
MGVRVLGFAIGSVCDGGGGMSEKKGCIVCGELTCWRIGADSTVQSMDSLLEQQANEQAERVMQIVSPDRQLRSGPTRGEEAVARALLVVGLQLARIAERQTECRSA